MDQTSQYIDSVVLHAVADRRLRNAAFHRSAATKYYRARRNEILRLFCCPAVSAWAADDAGLRRIGQADLARDLANFKAGLAGVSVAGAFLPANTPGTIEHWMLNEYYQTDEAFVFAIANTMHEEYQAIVDAGFLLQIDDPDLLMAGTAYLTSPYRNTANTPRCESGR
jgi:hypothetical protein